MAIIKTTITNVKNVQKVITNHKNNRLLLFVLHVHEGGNKMSQENHRVLIWDGNRKKIV